MAFGSVKALTFDVGGSVFDWQSAVRDAVRSLADEQRVDVDDHAFAIDWRVRMFQLLAQVRSGELPWLNADDLHRRALDDLAPKYDVLDLPPRKRDALTMVWHRLDAWPDVPEALEDLRRHYAVIVLSVLSWSILVDSSKHAGLGWDGMLSCEFLGHYKPDREAYLAAARLLRASPDEVMMVAVHPGDLRAAQNAGFHTAYVAPKIEEPGSRGETTGFDIVAEDYPDLVRRIC
ncbi:MAG: haloacid dehalogenase type II [Gammaproteobacteria bacterium]